VHDPIATKLEELSATPIACNQPLAAYTSFRIGGPADYLASPTSADQVGSLVRAARDLSLPVTFMGQGTNLLVRDGGVRGLVIRLGPGLARIDVNPPRIRAETGAKVRDLCEAAAEHSLTGLEFAVGIPGTLGGALAMNAGAYGGSIGDLVLEVRAVRTDGESRVFGRDDCAFGYRTSAFRAEGWIALEATLGLAPGDADAIRERHRDYCARRRASQPLDAPSAGSVFKRPAGHFAGPLIESAGLKGTRIGGAQVSEKHANFIINTGGATAADVLALIDLVTARVLEVHGVRLEPEVIVIGEDHAA